MVGGYALEYNLTINISVYTEANSTFPKPTNENYDYWNPLLNYFLTRSDTIEIHCWNEEIETINELKLLFNGKMDMVKEENITIFKLIKSTITIDYLLNNSVNKNGELKWFTVNLEKLMKPVFHSGHWGTEFFIPNVTKEDIAYIKSITPERAILHEF